MKVGKGFVRAAHLELAIEFGQPVRHRGNARLHLERERPGAQPHPGASQLPPQLGGGQLQQFHADSSRPILRRLSSVICSQFVELRRLRHAEAGCQRDSEFVRGATGVLATGLIQRQRQRLRDSGCRPKPHRRRPLRLPSFSFSTGGKDEERNIGHCQLPSGQPRSFNMASESFSAAAVAHGSCF